MNADEKEILRNLCSKYKNFFKDNPKPFENPFAFGESVENIDEYLKALFSKYNDPELLLMLAIANLLTPIEDDRESDRFCNQLLSRQADDYRATLIMAYNADFHRGLINGEVLSRLSNFKTSDKKINSAKLYFEAKYYVDSDRDKYRQYLEKAVLFYEGNLLAVSHLLFRAPPTGKSKQIAREAMLVAQQYRENKSDDPLEILSFDSFIHENIFGIQEDYPHIKDHATYA